jgi:hypothetical protein
MKDILGDIPVDLFILSSSSMLLGSLKWLICTAVNLGFVVSIAGIDFLRHDLNMTLEVGRTGT